MEEKRTSSNSERSARGNRHDPPIIFYDKSSRREAPLAEPIQEAEMTVTSTSESHSGFMIEFSDSSSPKMARKEKNLRDMVPKSLRVKMEESSRLAEERRASRMSRSKSQEFIKSPRESPSSFKKMKELWALSQAKSTAKSPTESDCNKSPDFDQRKNLGDSPEKNGELPSKPKKRSHTNPTVTVEEEEEGGDNVSETGTYTIDSDVPSKDLIEARENIDEVFGVVRGSNSDADTDKDVSDDEIQEDIVKTKGKKPGWVEQWANEASQKSNGTNMEGSQYSQDHQECEEVSGHTAQQGRRQLTPLKKSSSPSLESPSKGQRSRRLLPTIPSYRKKTNGHISPPPSPEPKSEPFMRTSQSAFSFQSDNGLYATKDNARSISKSSTKLSVDDTEDTEILLKDTETLMHHLEERMKKHKAVSEERQQQQFSKEEEINDDEDTSEVFDISNSECSLTVPSAGSASVSSKKGRTSPAPKTSSRWSRLSTPNKHKVSAPSEQEKPAQGKGSQSRGSKTSQAKPAEGKSNFQRNTYRTSSLPSENEKLKKSKKGSSTAALKSKQKNNEVASTPSKPKQSVVLPRQTRSTLLRKSRFTGSSGNICDVSPASSISDLSSSKAPVTPWRKKSLPNISQGKFSCSDTDVGLYSTRKQMEKRGSSAKSEPKVGGKLQSSGNRSRSKSMGENNLKPPSKTNKKTAVSPGNSQNLKNSSKSPTTIEAYINAVRERRSESVNSSTSAKRQEPTKPVVKKEIHSQDNHVQQEEPSQGVVAQVQPDKLIKDLDHLSKDENTVDDILGEDMFATSIFKTSRELKSQRHKRLEVRLKRCASLDLGDEYPKDLPFERKSLLKRHGPGESGKSESFDDLVLSSINHLSKKLRDSADQLLTKINPSTSHPIPHPEMDRDYPFLKTENREIAHILHNLRKMERKLEEIHSFVDNKGEPRSPAGAKRLTPARRWNKPPDLIQSDDGVETMI